MKRNAALVLATSVATLMGGAALADKGFITGHHDLPDQENNVHMGNTMRAHFDHADQDRDGKVSRSEMEAHVKAANDFKSMFEERSGRKDR